MRHLTIYILGLLFLTTYCGQVDNTTQIDTSTVQATKKKRTDEPAIYGVQGDDKEMIEAIKTANQTLYKFNEECKRTNAFIGNFALKVRFRTKSGAEHIWVSTVIIDSGNYFGIVDNLPESITEVKLGDYIKIDKYKISDWMYTEHGRLRGGYTIRLLRNRMTNDEREQFDKESGLIIE